MNRLRKLSILLSLCCSVLWNNSRSDASIMVTVQNTSITAGGTGFVDVLISSNSGDVLDFADYEFAITNIGGPASTLTFTGTIDEVGSAPYVFAGDNVGIMVTTIPPITGQIAANDSTSSGTGVALPDGSLLNPAVLLARLNLLHILGPGQSANDALGEQFQISLVDATSLFQDPASNNLLFNSTPGTITVSAAAVPEPSTFVVIAMALGGFGIHRRRKNRMEAAA